VHTPTNGSLVDDIVHHSPASVTFCISLRNIGGRVALGPPARAKGIAPSPPAADRPSWEACPREDQTYHLRLEYLARLRLNVIHHPMEEHRVQQRPKGVFNLLRRHSLSMSACGRLTLLACLVPRNRHR
jgi:hypothetical protein